MWIDFLARFPGQKETAATVAVQSAEQAFALDHLTQGAHHRTRGFFFDQMVVAVVGEPAMLAATHLQQHTRQSAASACAEDASGASWAGRIALLLARSASLTGS